MRRFNILLSGLLAVQTLLAPAQSSLPDAPQAKPVVYKVGGDVISPKVISAVDPEFTEEARKQRVQGIVAVSLVIDAQGKPHEVKVARSLAYMVAPKYRAAAKGLDQKAVEAVKQYRFQPGTLKGEPVSVSLNIEVNFQLF